MPLLFEDRKIIEKTVECVNATVVAYEIAPHALHRNAVEFAEVEQSIVSREIAARLAGEIESLRIGAEQFSAMLIDKGDA